MAMNAVMIITYHNAVAVLMCVVVDSSTLYKLTISAVMANMYKFLLVRYAALILYKVEQLLVMVMHVVAGYRMILMVHKYVVEVSASQHNTYRSTNFISKLDFKNHFSIYRPHPQIHLINMMTLYTH